MQFSIRALLALTFLAVLGMLLWRTRQETLRHEQRLVKLQNEVKSLEFEVRRDQPDLHQAIPASGYRLTVISERKSGPVRWELTSNHSKFEPHTQAIPLDKFSHLGGRWAVTDVIQFPNQIDRFAVGRLKIAPQSPPGVNLMDAKLRGSRDGLQYEITFTVRLLSDGPVCVSATDAQRLIILGRKDLLLPYKGGGKYDLKPAES